MTTAMIFDSTAALDSGPWFGPYRVTERIAAGGTAHVFRGEDPQTGELVALKTVRTGVLHESVVLEREIATLRTLCHPDIVRYVANGTCDGVPWMAMELLQGRTLFEEIASLWEQEDRRQDPFGRDRRHDPRAQADRRRRCPTTVRIQAPVESCATEEGWVVRLRNDPALAFPTRQAAAGRPRAVLALFMRLLPALDYLHGLGIVHGDLKPSNVLRGDDGRLTLLDFGAAHRPRRRHRGTVADEGCRVGTMEYAAPEQILGDRMDTTADIYSLGCILYELLTGRLPFEGESPGDIARQQLDEPPTCPSDLVSGLSSGLEDLVLGMLAKDPTRRPRNVRDLARRLDVLLPTCDHRYRC